MDLVGYSDSEDSDDETKSTQQPTPKTTSVHGKPAFQKVIDRTNPHKIKVNLPEASKPEQDNGDGPPAKRAKIGGGVLGGFNSFLPAPKKTIATLGGSVGGARNGGLGSGVNLKTGAAPGFSREPMPIREVEESTEEQASEGGQEDTYYESGNGKGLEALATKEGSLATPTEPPEEFKKKGNAMLFKPLSVARKPQKKKKTSVETPSTAHPPYPSNPSPAPPKLSLFSIATPDERVEISNPSATAYRPLIYETATHINEVGDSNDNNISTSAPTLATAPNSTPKSLSTIASDLHLSASARRQLLGRPRSGEPGAEAAINIVNFNTDQEYAANEALRQAGEQAAVHAPVRAIAGGKHSLQHLVNAVAGQREALEEQFAAGRRNKKEAGSKYGW